jgi:hypothetical protein
MPFSHPIMKGLGIDATRVASSPFSIDGDMNQRKEFIKHRGLNSSYLEHKILENLLGEESISAVKALQIAAQNGIPIYTVNKSNINSILPTLTISENDKADIQNAVNAGKEVTVSRDNMTLQEWTGVGYIVRDPNTGSGSYMISNALGGGGTVQPSNPKFQNEIKRAYFICGREIWYKWIGWWHTFVWTYRIGQLAIWAKYGYATYIDLYANAERVKSAANSPDNWIFYYSGHGNSEGDGTIGVDYLEPSINDSVLPRDINADSKIVFLNGCSSAKYSVLPDGKTLTNFAKSFGIDGYHNGQAREEAFLGWDAEVDIESQDKFAFIFWLKMGKGLTVDQAISETKEEVDKANKFAYSLQRRGNGGTTLESWK